MSLDRLWAGWRGEYMAVAGDPDVACVFCRILASGEPQLAFRRGAAFAPRLVRAAGPTVGGLDPLADPHWQLRTLGEGIAPEGRTPAAYLRFPLPPEPGA